MFTGASETLRLSGIDEDINTSGRYQAVRPRALAMDRVTGADDFRRLLASPDVAVGSAAALTETGSLVIASASGSQLPGYAGGAARAIWIVGAQKVVPDLSTALRRVEDHCLPLESARAQVAYGGGLAGGCVARMRRRAEEASMVGAAARCSNPQRREAAGGSIRAHWHRRHDSDGGIIGAIIGAMIVVALASFLIKRFAKRETV